MQTYRTSHTVSGYAKDYDGALDTGYYGIQWRMVERPLVERLASGISANDASANVLDFACGTARISSLLVEHYNTVVGVDISAEMLSLATAKAPSAIFLQGDITSDAELCKGPYSFITAFRFFMNAEDDLRRAAMDALSSRQESGGFILASVQCNGNSPLGLFHRIRNMLGIGRQRTMTTTEMRRLLAGASYSVVCVHRYGLLPRFGASQWPGMSIAMRAAEKVLQLVPFIGAVAQCFIVLAVKSKTK